MAAAGSNDSFQTRRVGAVARNVRRLFFRFDLPRSFIRPVSLDSSVMSDLSEFIANDGGALTRLRWTRVLREIEEKKHNNRMSQYEIPCKSETTRRELFGFLR